MKRLAGVLLLTTFLALVIAPVLAEAAPRSGASFSGRGGFRSNGSSYSRSYSSGRTRSAGGPGVVIFPSFWGFSPFGFGGGSMLGTLMILGVLGFGGAMLYRAVRRSHRRYGEQLVGGGYRDDDDEADVAPGAAYVYKVQLGLGRSARGLQKRLESFASEGDTSSEAGLALLLQQTALELLREKESIRYGSTEASGPLSLTNGETKLNALALAERSRFQVERVRGADGKVRRSDAAATASAEVLEYLVVTVLVATRAPLPALKELTDRDTIDAVLGALGGVPPEGMLGLEVIWTPADEQDALTEAEMLVTYPAMRGL